MCVQYTCFILYINHTHACKCTSVGMIVSFLQIPPTTSIRCSFSTARFINFQIFFFPRHNYFVTRLLNTYKFPVEHLFQLIYLSWKFSTGWHNYTRRHLYFLQKSLTCLRGCWKLYGFNYFQIPDQITNIVKYVIFLCYLFYFIFLLFRSNAYPKSFQHPMIYPQCVHVSKICV